MEWVTVRRSISQNVDCIHETVSHLRAPFRHEDSKGGGGDKVGAYWGVHEQTSMVDSHDYPRAALHPAALASSSEQNMRSPSFSLIRVRS